MRGCTCYHASKGKNKLHLEGKKIQNKEMHVSVTAFQQRLCTYFCETDFRPKVENTVKHAHKQCLVVVALLKNTENTI